MIKIKKKKKILIISEFFPRSEVGEARGGVEMRSWQIAKRLSDIYEIIVLTSRENDLPREDSFFNIKVIRCGPTRHYTQGGSLFKRLSFMISIYREGLRLQPDVVDAQSIVTYLPTYWLAKKLKVRSIITCHDVWVGKWLKLFGITGIIGELYERYYLSRKWGIFIANSHYTKDNLIHRGVTEDKIKVVPNGIDTKFLRDIQVNKFDEFTICSITRLVSYKRVVDLIRAVALIKKKLPSIKCKIIGSGPEIQYIKDEINKLRLGNTVELMGFIRNHDVVMKILKRSHVFCLTSEVEGFGIVVAEAMACGVPVITTKIPPLIEVTQNGQGAILYTLGDISELSEKILAITKNRNLYNDYVSNGIKIVQKYDWNNIIVEIDKIYKNLI